MASILVCDDEPVIVELLATTLEAHGFLVPVAHRGEEAVQLALLHQPDLLLLDLELPDMTGLEILRRLRESECCRDTPAIFLSGIADPRIVEEARAFGVVDYVIKSAMRTRELIELIRSTLERCRGSSNDRPSGHDDPFEQALDDSESPPTRIMDGEARTLSLMGRWRLQQKIGRGSMGDVYLADSGDARAAIKILPRDPGASEELRWRFQREIEALSSLHHPHIVEFVESGIVDDRPYLVMDYIHAPNLRQYHQLRGRIDAREARTLITQVADALRCAWDAGIVHRDVKPSNILVDGPRNGRSEPFCLKLCDFGLARFRDRLYGDRSSDGDSTRPGIVLGTPAYMSPEQANGQSLADQRQDIYSLGATTYFALFGRPPFSGSERTMMARRVSEDLDPSGLRELDDPPLADLLSQMLARLPERRVGSWEEVLVRLPA